MIVKILICPCFTEGFHSCQDQYIKKLIHFYCKCKDKHKCFVSTCKEHPLLFSRLEAMSSECNCKNSGPFEPCDSCVQMRCLLDFRCFKFCMEKIPKWLGNSLVPLDSYLEHDTSKCESFFFFKNNKVCGSLDKYPLAI